MSKFVISTLTADTRYTNWKHSSGINMPDGDVLVRGGAGISLRDGSRVVTPLGVQTEVSDEDATFLAEHPHFKAHKKAGFVQICDSSQVPDKAAKDMATDASAPKTDKDVAADNKKNTPPGAEPLTAVAATDKPAPKK